MLQGLLTAIVTPFSPNMDIDYVSYEKLIEYQINNGANGLVVLGSTGEGSALSLHDKMQVINFAIKTIAKRVSVIVGVSIPGTQEATDYINILNKIDGIDYIMIAAPCYVKPTQEGLYQHFLHLSYISIKPIILYNVPGRTACDIGDDIVLRLSHDSSNIVGLKDATGDLARLTNIHKNKPHDFLLFSGDDGTAMEFMLLGGNGVISVLGNLLPSKMSKLCHASIANEITIARHINDELLEFYELMGIESNPIPVKWALFANKIISHPVLRLPLTALTKDNQLRMITALKQVMLIT